MVHDRRLPPRQRRRRRLLFGEDIARLRRRRGLCGGQAGGGNGETAVDGAAAVEGLSIGQGERAAGQPRHVERCAVGNGDRRGMGEYRWRGGRQFQRAGVDVHRAGEVVGIVAERQSPTARLGKATAAGELAVDDYVPVRGAGGLDRGVAGQRERAGQRGIPVGAGVPQERPALQGHGLGVGLIAPGNEVQDRAVGDGRALVGGAQAGAVANLQYSLADQDRPAARRAAAEQQDAGAGLGQIARAVDFSGRAKLEGAAGDDVDRAAAGVDAEGPGVVDVVRFVVLAGTEAERAVVENHRLVSGCRIPSFSPSHWPSRCRWRVPVLEICISSMPPPLTRMLPAKSFHRHPS